MKPTLRVRPCQEQISPRPLAAKSRLATPFLRCFYIETAYYKPPIPSVPRVGGILPSSIPDASGRTQT